jgi:hypothetical protein
MDTTSRTKSLGVRALAGGGSGAFGRGRRPVREGADGGAGGVVRASSRSCQMLVYLVARYAAALVSHCFFSGCGNGNGNRVRFFYLLSAAAVRVCAAQCQGALAAAFLRISSVDDMVLQRDDLGALL